MFRRFCALIAAAAAAVALAACIMPEQADARSAVVATATHHCSEVAATAKKRGFRTLSSARLDKARRYCSEARARIGMIRFWTRPMHSWTLYNRYRHYTCWSLRRKRLLEGPQALCALARGAVRTNIKKLVNLDKRIKAFLPRPHLVHDGLYNLFLCVHAGEGAWTDDTGNGYYGGLQMNISFMREYGPAFVKRWGTANNWPPWAQITAAERAYRSGRGIGPWPNTGPPCAARFK